LSVAESGSAEEDDVDRTGGSPLQGPAIELGAQEADEVDSAYIIEDADACLVFGSVDAPGPSDAAVGPPLAAADVPASDDAVRVVSLAAGIAPVPRGIITEPAGGNDDAGGGTDVPEGPVAYGSQAGATASRPSSGPLGAGGGHAGRGARPLALAAGKGATPRPSSTSSLLRLRLSGLLPQVAAPSGGEKQGGADGAPQPPQPEGHPAAATAAVSAVSAVTGRAATAAARLTGDGSGWGPLNLHGSDTQQAVNQHLARCGAVRCAAPLLQGAA
jgi:hypothetical protein